MMTAFYDINFYYSVDTVNCVLTNTHPYIYYVSYLTPLCAVLLVNSGVFVLVSRILFQKRVVGNINALLDNKITMAQVRGAFTVMTLLGVTWIFGAFAIGEAKVVFQYVFFITNSVQGFIIFVVRCMQYSEARMAWATLLRTGKFKKYCGVLPTSSTRHTMSSTTLESQATRNAALDNTIGTTCTLWIRLFLRKTHQKQKLHSYSNYSFRNAFGSARLPNYLPKNGQKRSTISNDICEMNSASAPIDGVLMREMQRSLPVSHSSYSSKKSMQYATCIPCISTDDTKQRAIQNNSADCPPLDTIRKAWSQESLYNKEGEDSSWQFMRVPMSKRKENAAATKGAIKKVTPATNGKVSTTYSADQGYMYMTAEHSPESPRQRVRHLHNPNPQQACTSTRPTKPPTEDLASSPEEIDHAALTPTQMQDDDEDGDDELGEHEYAVILPIPDPKNQRDFQVSEALL